MHQQFSSQQQQELSSCGGANKNENILHRQFTSSSSLSLGPTHFSSNIRIASYNFHRIKPQNIQPHVLWSCNLSSSTNLKVQIFWSSANRFEKDERWTRARRKHKLFVCILLDIIDVNKLNLCNYFIIFMVALCWRFVFDEIVYVSWNWKERHRLARQQQQRRNKEIHETFDSELHLFIHCESATAVGLVADIGFFGANIFHGNK